MKRISTSSYVPARAPVIRTASTPSAHTSAMKRSLKARIPIVPAFRSEAAQYPNFGPPPFFYEHHAIFCSNATPLRTTTALFGHRIVVAALERHPVGLQIFRARQVLGPGVARHQCRRLPDDVELAVRTDLADIDRFGDVVVGQHLGGAASEVGSLDAGQRVDHLVRIGRFHLLDRLHPHGKANEVGWCGVWEGSWRCRQ